MNKRKRTNNSKYKHESTGDYCTCSAYVAEIMCRKNAENKNEGSLPYKFWNKKPWNWTFKRQVFAANKLLKKFSEEALVKAVNSAEFRGIFSLNHPKVIGVLKKYESLLNEQKARPKQEIDFKKNPKKRRGSYGGGNILDKLRKIENGQEEDI
tara:strand:+ start:1832 stop:2290 length:459 start_codon:yes stop_codon:yes gene_type:complete